MLRLRGISEEIYYKLLEFQGGKCAICPSEVPWSRSDRWAVDHNHTTGEVRGLLCVSCNNGLGRFKDDAESLRSAADYLESTPYSQMTAAKLISM